MKKSVYVILTCLAIACACTRESLSEAVGAIKDPTEKEMCSASLRLNVALNETKSQYQVSDLKTIHNVWVLGVASDGFWRVAYFTESDLTKEGSVVTCPSMSFKAGSSVTFYVTANMGDLSSLAISGTTANPAAIEYLLPLDVNFSTAGMPMAAQSSAVTVSAAGTGILVSLEPLLARLDITINKNGITGSVPAEVLASGELEVKHANRRLRPFGVSCALEPTDIFSVVIDKESFSTSSSYDMTHSNVILYVPENGMGNLLLPGSTQWDKGNTGAPGKYYATYLEYSCSKNGASDGIDGDLTYRFFLGEDATHNFSVHRNATYECTLDLTWNGLFFEGDWRIDNSDLTDGRRLTISDTPHTTSSSFTDWGRLRRNVASQLYINFSRDGGSTWVHSAKDIDGWPYGWDLYIDGVKQAAGASATAAGDLGWAYTSATAGDQIAITPGPSSVASSVHTLQVKSADGRVASNVVSFEVSQPLQFMWPYGNGNYYVAQRPILVQNIGLEDSSATITYTEKDGKTGIEFVSLSKTSMYLNLLAAGEYTIVATASNGQTGETTLTVLDPVVEQLWTTQPLWVDGTDSEKILRYTTTSGTEMTVASSDSQGYGTKFAPSLYETLLKPRITGVSEFNSVPFNTGVVNLISLSNEDKLYVNTLECTTPGKEIKVKDNLTTPFKVNIQAGAETFWYMTYFKNPFADVDITSNNETFHDFTTMYSHMTSSQITAYNASKTYTFASGSNKRIYAQPAYVLTQTSSEIQTTRDALVGTYSGGNSVSIGLTAGTEGGPSFYHPSGEKPVYIHVQNRHDVAAGGERARYSLSKQIGKAKIYMHAVFATAMKPQSSSSQYVIDILNSPRNYKKQTASDVWDIRYLYGGFLNNQDATSNGELKRLYINVATGNPAFVRLAVADEQGFQYISGDRVLTAPYGFVQKTGIYITSGDCALSMGYAILKTTDGSGNGVTWYWSTWKNSSTTSPFCTFDPSYDYTKVSWSENGLTGRYFKDDYSEYDGNMNGYLIIHLLQDMPVNPNNGYIE